MSTDGFSAASSGRRRWHVVGSLLVAALAVCVLPGVAAAKKPPQKPKVATFNLYLGTDLPNIDNPFNAGQGDPSAAGAAARAAALDRGANAIGFGLNDVNLNDFTVRAKTIAKLVNKKKIDVLGVQEASEWKVQIPTDATPLNPLGARAGLVTYDYLATLLDELNKKAMTGKECKKKGIPKAKCFKGYRIAVDREEFDAEFFGDFDNDPGPGGNAADPGAPNEGLGPSTAGVPRCAVGALASLPPDNIWKTPPTPGAPPYTEPGECGEGRGSGDNNAGAAITGPTNPTAPATAGNDDTGNKFGDPDDTAGTSTASGLPGDDFFNPDFNGDSNNDYEVVPAADGLPPNEYGSPAPAPPLGAASVVVTPVPGTTWGSDCPDTNASVIDPGAAGAAAGNSGPPFDGGDTFDPSTEAPGDDDSSACLVHGADGDVSLTQHDAIIVRKGVKTKNAQTGTFTANKTQSLVGGKVLIPNNRGWQSLDVKVRGKSFRVVNTHLEAEDDGTIREDQAAELIAPGGPATAPKTVLLGDLNSDPASSDPQSPPAYNLLAAGGFSSLTSSAATSGHADAGRVYASASETGALLNNPNDLATDSRIDHILTNSSKVKKKGGGLLDRFADGLWTSDHAGVFAGLKIKK